MNEITHDVVVVGGGIAGLTTAYHLHRAGVDAILVEASDAVGGCMRTEHRDGFLLEKGPFNVIVRDPAFQELLTELGDDVQVVSADPKARKRYIYRKNNVVLVPTNPVALFGSPLLSFGAKVRLLRGMLLSGRAGDSEYTIEEFAARRLGQEVADTMVSAVIAGVLAGDISKLSATACFPFIKDFDRKARSPLLFGLRKAVFGKKGKKCKPKRKWRGLVSIDKGLGAVGDAIAARLGDRVLTRMPVESVAREEGGYRLTCRAGDGESHTLGCRRLVMATPAAATGDLLAPLGSELARQLGAIESASLIVMNLAFKREDVGHPLEGFGFLVPQNEPDFPLMGVLWADSAFPHHAPDGQRLLRVFIGGTRTPDVMRYRHTELVDTAMGALRDLLDVRGEPSLIDVCPYPDAIPQYYLGHAERIERVRAELAKLPGLHLAGNYLDGVSINDCVRVGKQVAEQVVAAGTDAQAVSAT